MAYCRTSGRIYEISAAVEIREQVVTVIEPINRLLLYADGIIKSALAGLSAVHKNNERVKAAAGSEV